MKSILTLAFAFFALQSFSQDDFTDGIQTVDVEGSVSAYHESNLIHIQSTLTTPFVDQFRLYSADGKLMQSKPASGFSGTLNVANYAPGIYFLELRAGSDAIVKRLFVSGL